MSIKLGLSGLIGSGVYNYTWILPNITDAEFVSKTTRKISNLPFPEINIINYPVELKVQAYDVINDIIFETNYTIEEESSSLEESSSSTIESSSSVESSSSSETDEFYIHVSCIGGVEGNSIDFNNLLITDIPYGPALLPVGSLIVLEAISNIDWLFIEWQQYNFETGLWDTLSIDNPYFTTMPSENFFIRGYFETIEESSSEDESSSEYVIF